jgi:prolyl oligopeptidase
MISMIRSFPFSHPPIYLLFIPFLGCQQSAKFQPISVDYPETQKINHIDNYWGEEVPDPYRWLEDDYAEETKAWVKAQNEVTFDYFHQIPFRENIRKRLEDMWNYEKISAPFQRGEYTYYYKNDGLQNQSVLYRKKGEKGEEELFLDPNKLSEDGTTSLAGTAFTEDGRLFAYAVSVAGSDWRDIYVMDADSKTLLKDKIADAKFTGISWKGEEGFYYSTYEKPDGSKLSALTNHHLLYFHRLGTSQEEDELTFGNPEDPRRYVSGRVTEDQRYLIISAANSTTGNALYFQRKFPEALAAYRQRVALEQERGDDAAMAAAFGAVGFVHSRGSASVYSSVPPSGRGRRTEVTARSLRARCGGPRPRR